MEVLRRTTAKLGEVVRPTKTKFKIVTFVTRGHPRSNGLPLLYGHETWWMESSWDADNLEGQFKVTRGHPRSNGCCMDLKLCF